ncbi:hypothetical protein GCM10011415_22610 [Salipiger pallidus]|uniref:Integrase catalytic domain-containing protein n=1 Tax=Salipiger pallidus TaxID=1775170 RepID=A0A8J2ZJV5_9RHOB|nr:hypothetical protein GCM10011415_22610 [Salipiger pallidus]
MVATLDQLCRRSGYPDPPRVDQASEFLSRDLDLCVNQRSVTLHVSRPGEPMDNDFIEASDGRYSAECLHRFVSLADAREKLEDRCSHYIEDRPHSAIG